LDDAAQEVLRTALRAIGELRGRFGKGLVSATLTGSSAKEIARYGLQNRSCFGNLMGYRQAEVSEMLEALLATGMLQQQGEQFRPTLALTPRGKAFVDRNGDLPDPLPLSFALRTKMGQTQSESGRPSTSQAPRADSPSTSRRSSEYSSPGPPTPAQTSYANGSQTGARPSAPVAAAPKSTAGPSSPHYHWTVELLEKGYSVDEVAAIRRLEGAIVVEHALAAARAGRKVPWAPFREFSGGKESRVQLELLRSLVE
jgi:hypothetical protein